MITEYQRVDALLKGVFANYHNRAAKTSLTSQ